MPLRLRRLASSLRAVPAAALLLTLLAAVPARARVHVFFGFGGPVWGPPVYYPPPIYYPPPVYYYYPPPPPVVYAPPDAGPAPGPAALARSCDAGAYVCPLEHPLPVGTQCWCRDNDGRRAYGQAG